MKQNGKDKFIVAVKVGEKGQIIVPKEARDMFDIHPGDTLMFLGDKNKGMALLKAEKVYEMMEENQKWIMQ